MPSPKRPAPKVIATRKACKADGIGLSHFVLMAPPPAKPKAPIQSAKP